MLSTIRWTFPRDIFRERRLLRMTFEVGVPNPARTEPRATPSFFDAVSCGSYWKAKRRPAPFGVGMGQCSVAFSSPWNDPAFPTPEHAISNAVQRNRNFPEPV